MSKKTQQKHPSYGFEVYGVTVSDHLVMSIKRTRGEARALATQLRKISLTPKDVRVCRLTVEAVPIK